MSHTPDPITGYRSTWGFGLNEVRIFASVEIAEMIKIALPGIKSSIRSSDIDIVGSYIFVYAEGRVGIVPMDKPMESVGWISEKFVIDYNYNPKNLKGLFMTLSFLECWRAPIKLKVSYYHRKLMVDVIKQVNKLITDYFNNYKETPKVIGRPLIVDECTTILEKIDIPMIGLVGPHPTISFGLLDIRLVDPILNIVDRSIMPNKHYEFNVSTISNFGMHEMFGKNYIVVMVKDNPNTVLIPCEKVGESGKLSIDKMKKGIHGFVNTTNAYAEEAKTRTKHIFYYHKGSFIFNGIKLHVSRVIGAGPENSTDFNIYYFGGKELSHGIVKCDNKDSRDNLLRLILLLTGQVPLADFINN